MNKYHYSQSKVVDEITFEKSEKGASRAYLHALPGADEKTLADISHTLAKRGWQTIPYSKNGTHLLEVRGFSREGQVQELLAEKKWIEGTAQKTEDKKQTGIIDTVKNRSLFLSGMLYMLGDISFFGYGMKKRSKLDMAAGLAYAGGTLSSLIFARKDSPELEIKDISKKMAEHIREHDNSLPTDSCALNSIAEHKHKNPLKQIDEYMRRYPSEAMNTFFGIAGACIAAAAYKRTITPGIKPQAVKNGIADMALGLGTMASATFGNLVEEKARDPDMPRKKGLSGIWEWMQERPLAITGTGYMVSTMMHAHSTHSEWKIATTPKDKTALKLRATFVATNLLAEALIAISSKGHGEGVMTDKSTDESVIAVTADLIAKQPTYRQQELIDYMAPFLGRDDVLAMKDEDIKTRLNAEVAIMRKNPWASCKIEPASQEKTASLPPPEKADWQTLIGTSRQAASPANFI